MPFAPPPGLNSDDTTNAAEGQWADGSNVRFRLGKPETVGASTQQFTLSTVAPVLDIFAFMRSGTAAVAYGTAGEVHVGDLSSATQRLSGGGTVGFSFAAWGDTLLMAGYGAKLYDQSGTSSAAEVLEAPDRIDAGIIVTPERQVMAFATNEVGGSHNSRCIRISDIEDYSSAGSWTPTATNNSDEIILDFPIICARQVGPYVAVWTTNALYLGTFVGDPAQCYRFDKVADTPRPMTVRSVVTMGGLVYWMGYDFQMRVWGPGAQPQVIPCPISRDMIDNSKVPSGCHASYAVTNTEHGEVWFFYEDTRDTTDFASRYIAYSVDESALAGRPVWFRGQLARSIMIDSEIVRNVASVSGESMLGATEAAVVYLHDHRTSGGLTVFIQSADFYLDESQRRMMARGVVTDFEYQSATVSLTLYAKDRPLSTAVSKGPYSLTTSTNKKDFRASGKLVAVKFSGGNRWRLGKTLFDVVPMGER